MRANRLLSLAPILLFIAIPQARSMLDSLNTQIGVDDFHRAGIKGKGVIIGLSEEVDYSLWDFRNADGSTRFLQYHQKPRAGYATHP